MTIGNSMTLASSEGKWILHDPTSGRRRAATLEGQIARIGQGSSMFQLGQAGFAISPRMSVEVSYPTSPIFKHRTALFPLPFACPDALSAWYTRRAALRLQHPGALWRILPPFHAAHRSTTVR